MNSILEQRVRQLAAMRCEYCKMPESSSPLPFVFDHVIARQHGGKTELENLALCCPWCNRHKGPNIAGVDPISNEGVFLFHPRSQDWTDHFRIDGFEIQGLTAIGRATVVVLKLNHSKHMAARAALIAEGTFGLFIIDE